MKTILFVEDDAVVAHTYGAKFARAGFHVEVAQDGLEAVKMLPLVRPNIVVLDLMMPKLNGADVLKFIREDSVLRSTPVIILSDAFMSDLAGEAVKIGPNLALLKSSCTPSLLIAAICHVFAGNITKFEPSRQLSVKTSAA